METKNNEGIGLDLVDDMPDYTKSSEINQERIKRDYKEVFGVYLDDISKDDNN